MAGLAQRPQVVSGIGPTSRQRPDVVNHRSPGAAGYTAWLTSQHPAAKALPRGTVASARCCGTLCLVSQAARRPREHGAARLRTGRGQPATHGRSIAMEGLEPTPESEVEGFQEVLVDTQPPSDREAFPQNDPQPSTPSMAAREKVKSGNPSDRAKPVFHFSEKTGVGLAPRRAAVSSLAPGGSDSKRVWHKSASFVQKQAKKCTPPSRRP